MSQNVLLLAIKLPGMNDHQLTSSLAELESLSETAGGSPVRTIVQNKQRIDAAYYIGEGKAFEIAEIVEAEAIDLVISNDELSPGQVRNLTDAIGTQVIDRSQLILDIFARRARTKEAKLQVELAQLQYRLPRLRGKGEEMSRLGAGIGTRGPGETKLETDQRYIRRRIDDIKDQLRQTAKQREQYRKRRKTNNIFQIAIVGYTNAGKSTLFNQLAKSESSVEDKLFATLDPLTRYIMLPSGFQTLITDTVGFIQDLPTTLIASFRSTLEEVSEADFILHIADVTNDDLVQHQQTVNHLLYELNANTIPQLMIYNKKDQLNEEFIPMQYPNMQISAHDSSDVKYVLERIEDLLKQEWEYYTVELAPEEGKLLYRLETETIMIQRQFEETINAYAIKGYIRPDHALKGLLSDNPSFTIFYNN